MMRTSAARGTPTRPRPDDEVNAFYCIALHCIALYYVALHVIGHNSLPSTSPPQKSFTIMISTTRRNFLQKELISFNHDEALSSFKVEEIANVVAPP